MQRSEKLSAIITAYKAGNEDLAAELIQQLTGPEIFFCGFSFDAFCLYYGITDIKKGAFKQFFLHAQATKHDIA